MENLVEHRVKGYKSMPSISVIMLTYNREKFVERAVKSVLEQTFKDFEMIIVDNGSTDSSGDICEKLAQQDTRIKVIHKNKGNIGSGRNAGLDVANGEYVAFIDDDDYCMPGFLDFLYGLTIAYDADIAVCGSYIEEDGILSPNGRYVYDELYIMDAYKAVEKYLWRQLYNCAMPTKLVRRHLFEQIRFSVEGSYDDINTAYKYFSNATKIVAHGKPHYVFYRHAGNNSSAATKHHLLNPVQLNEYLQAFHERTDYISKVLPKLTALSRYSEWSYMLSMIEKIQRFQLTNCNDIMKYMKEQIGSNLNEFLTGSFVLDFEKEWLDAFILKKEKRS